MTVRRIFMILIALALAACTRLVVLTPPPDGGTDGLEPDSVILPDAGTLEDGGAVLD